jgi:hypothetical protein
MKANKMHFVRLGPHYKVKFVCIKIAVVAVARYVVVWSASYDY